MSNLAISYARFSSARQIEGDSLRRQIENAEKYAQANGLVIDPSMSFTDLGVSAYDKSNINRGALGLFLRAVQDGKIPIGATLIIESFDRLSRATPLDALSVFTGIVNAGLTLVTLTTPPRVFNRASVEANMFQLFEALMDMHRANAESERKSQLIGAAWAQKKISARSGTLMTGKSPHWIKVLTDQNLSKDNPHKRTAALIPDRAVVVMRIIDMAERGVGNNSILQVLNSEGIPSFSKQGSWQQSYVQKMLTSPALYGAIALDGEIYENYYPPLITPERFALLQHLRSARATRKTANRKGKSVTNLFSGLLKCGYCGGPMNVAGYKSRITGYDRKYVGCHMARTNTSACKFTAWFLDELEDTLLFWLTQLDFSKIVGNTDRTAADTHRELLASAENAASVLEKSIENGYAAVLEGLEGMVPRIKKSELELVKIKKLVAAQLKKVAAIGSHENGAGSRMKNMVLLFKMLKHTKTDQELRTLREQLSAAANLVVEQITLYALGRTPQAFPAGKTGYAQKREARYIDVKFKNGVERRIEPGEA